MHLGNFSISLAVKDINASQAFYEKLGFIQIMDDAAQGWLILRSGSTKIGLFQGLFEKNTLTFNPVWDDDGNADATSEDIRSIQKRLTAAGIDVGPDIGAGTSGPASFSILDPDGNPVLIDQHV